MILTTNRTAVILLGVSAHIVLTALFLLRFEPRVENTLEQDSRRALQQENIFWARVEAEGRDLTVSGMAPDIDLKNRTLRIINNLDGVRKVHDKMLITRTQPLITDAAEIERRTQELVADIEDTAPIFALDLPYELHLEIEASVLTISGLVPDDVAKESLTNLANRHYGSGRIIDRMISSPGAPDGYLTVASKAIEAAAHLVRGVIGVTDHEVYVQGITSNDQAAASIEQIFEPELPNHYTSRIQTGNQSDLTQLLRTHPDLAARVGAFDGSSQDTTVITPATAQPKPTKTNEPTATPSALAALDITACQNEFDQLLNNHSIGFETGSSEISQESLKVVAELVTLAKRCRRLVIEIAGHTDDQGTTENNLALSQRRAEAVMEYLVKNGVSLSRLRAAGYGEDQPIVENSTAANRKINRRIEFNLFEENNL